MDFNGYNRFSAPATDPQTDPSDPKQTQSDPKLVDL